jgi:hypothetical protein
MDSAAGPDRHWRGRLQEPEECQEPLAGASDASLADFWKTAIQKYTVCNLTMGKDKLIAMWGIAKLVRDALRIEYGEGLWEQGLEDQLAWRVTECTLKVRPSESTEVKIARKIPSWSWASMDGKIEVPDRLSNVPHYTVKDHDNRPLAFDLKGVKRVAEPTRIGDKASPDQARGMSDSVAEMQRRYKDMEKEGMTEPKTGDHHSEEVNRDDPPEFYSKSIAIQGHVGRGSLKWIALKGQWCLRADGVLEDAIDAFPDTMPNEEDTIEANPFFVVLSAKKVTRDEAVFKNTGLEDTKKPTIDWVISGHGILMKEYKADHFFRTGAFSFRKVENEVFLKLQQTYGSQNLASDKYDSARGRKFWLD